MMRFPLSNKIESVTECRDESGDMNIDQPLFVPEWGHVEPPGDTRLSVTIIYLITPFVTALF